MGEKPNHHQFKLPIPKKSVHILKFLVYRIGRISIIAAKTQTYNLSYKTPGIEKMRDATFEISSQLM